MTETSSHTSSKPANLSPETVKVGDGVTHHLWTDRHAGTVTWVSPSGKTFRWTRDRAIANGPTHDRGQYDYSYESTPVSGWLDLVTGKTVTNENTARWSASRGRFRTGGSSMSSGRHEYYDPSF